MVAGIVDPARVARNSAAQAGDLLLLSKPLGVGVMTTALKKGLLPPEGYAEVRLHEMGAFAAACVAFCLATQRGFLSHCRQCCKCASVPSALMLHDVANHTS